MAKKGNEVNKKILVLKREGYKDAYIKKILMGKKSGIETSMDIKEAMDIADLDFNMFASICKGLQQSGFKTEVKFV